MEIPLEMETIERLLVSFLQKNMSNASMELFRDINYKTTDDLYRAVGITIFNEIVNDILKAQVLEKEKENEENERD